MVDSQLVDRAQNALRRNPHLAKRNLNLSTDQGRVVLSGKVNSFFQKQMAQEALRGEGLHDIDNQLEVHWSNAQLVEGNSGLL